MLRLLLVHSDVRGSDGIRDALSACACDAELTHVRNATGFRAAMEQWRFDAVLLDYTPWSSEGSTLLALATQWQPVTPTIALCAHAAEDHGRTALQEGATDYVLGEQLARLAATIRRAVANIESRARA